MKIKILHVVSGDLWAGAEAQALVLIAQLVKRPEFDIRAILFNDGRLAREMAMTGAKVSVINESRYSSLAILKRLTDSLRNDGVGIVHTHGYKQHALGSLAAKLAGVGSVVTTVHGLTELYSGIKRHKMSLYRTLDGVCTRNFTDWVVAVSDNIKRQLEKQAKIKRVVTIHNGIEIERVRPRTSPELVRRDLGISPDDAVVGTVGRLVPVKGLEYLLLAALGLRHQLRNAKYLIVGDGVSRSQLQEVVEQTGLKDKVIFSGYREDVYDLINAMDVFVLPSIDEGIPTVLLEAMALQKPIVATSVGGIPELICDGHTGFLVQPKNALALGTCIKRLISNCQVSREMGLRARARIEQDYTASKQASRTAMLYMNATLVRKSGDALRSGVAGHV